MLLTVAIVLMAQSLEDERGEREEGAACAKPNISTSSYLTSRSASEHQVTEAHVQIYDSHEADSVLVKLTVCHFETASRRNLARYSSDCLAFLPPAPPCLRRQLSRAGSCSRLHPRQ